MSIPVFPDLKDESANEGRKFHQFEEYFDPGNLVYMFAMRLVFENVFTVEGMNWNAETVGDIFESILGLSWLRKSQQPAPNTAIAEWIDPKSAIAEWIDEYVFCIVKFMQSTAWHDVTSLESFPQWRAFVLNAIASP